MVIGNIISVINEKVTFEQRTVESEEGNQLDIYTFQKKEQKVREL